MGGTTATSITLWLPGRTDCTRPQGKRPSCTTCGRPLPASLQGSPSLPLLATTSALMVGRRSAKDVLSTFLRGRQMMWRFFLSYWLRWFRRMRLDLSSYLSGTTHYDAIVSFGSYFVRVSVDTTKDKLDISVKQKRTHVYVHKSSPSRTSVLMLLFGMLDLSPRKALPPSG